MKLCSFFGHRDTQVDIQPILRDIVINLIEKENVTLFYVGLEGNFDSIALQTLEELAKTYTQIKYYVVLAYMPKSKNKDLIFEKYNTIYPDGLEKTPLKYALHRRNCWMVKKSDYVVTYVKRSFGGASQFKELAEKQNKTVINIYDTLRTDIK